MKTVKLFEQFISEKELFKGGLADGMTAQDLADKHGVSLEEIEAALDKGQKVEVEHTGDDQKALEIAKDHIFEDPKYYDKLAKIEGEPTDEAVRVETFRYKASHGKEPKGQGVWMFSYNKSGDDYFPAPKSMSYADAVKWAKGKAKEDNKDYVYVMEAEDHEVGMAQGQLEAIHKDAAELQQKIGMNEKDLPGWIQSHITSAYEYLKQANDNFHELEEAETNEALKMLMDPLMVKIMKNFGFKADPAIRAELKAEIEAAVKQVLQKHDVIVENDESEDTEA